MKKYKIAVLLTCYNRKDKTIKALSGLETIICDHNKTADDRIEVSFFLTDDGCSDGTAEAARGALSQFPLKIITSDGNAYWAGGMRLAWSEALKSNISFDFYLLINDDTVFKANCIDELLQTHLYALEKYQKPGIYSAFISSASDESNITYGAKVYTKSIISKAVALKPNGAPIECSMVNANILMVASDVVIKIGILDNAFIHAAADMDYGLRAKKAGFPVLTTPSVCGYCEYDHDGSEAEREKVCAISLADRKKYLDRPNIKQYHDSIEFYWRYDKVRWLIFRLSYFLNLYAPSIYYKLYKRRGH